MKRAWLVGAVAVGVAWVGIGAAPSGDGGGSPGVVSIDLPRYVGELPPAEGREAFARDCLTCHSVSYINMTPPLSEAKWEDEARKMAKTYACPVPEGDVKAIAGYLVAVKEKGGGFTMSRAVMPHGDVPGWLVEAASSRDAGGSAASAGAAVFAKDCASCHGATGAGDGSSAKTQLPRATDLTSRVFTGEALAGALWNGVPGAAMPSYRYVPKDDLAALATYVAGMGKSDGAAAADAGAAAKEIYVRECARCHGADGRGDGEGAAGLARRPADFREKRLTVAAAEKAIADGVPGTAMPAWKAKFNAGQRKALAGYVGAFFGK